MRILVTLLLASVALTSVAQNGPLAQRQKLVKDVVTARHISPKTVDDAFSASFFSTYLSLLDGEHLHLTTANVKALESHRNSIDDDWNNGTTNFYTASAALYKTSLEATRTRINDICAKPFDFSQPDVYNFSADTSFALTDKALYTRWQHILKTEVLHALMNIAASQWQAKNAISKIEVLAKEPEVRARIKTKQLNKIAALLKDDVAYQQDLSSLYLNTFLLCLDPHSAFFNPAERQQFQRALNTEDYFFGLSLANDEKGEAYISYLAPGGAAWASGVLNKGDVPVRLQWQGSPAVDLAGLEAADISSLFDQHTKEKLELTVRKGNGQQQTVVLQKQKIENEDNIVKSFVLSGSQNFGYITLPSFYTQWEEKGGSRCAADVAREIVKLKKDSIAGLVLDLRFNGGGSLAEAVEMAGIFIDEGVICQMKTKEGRVEALKDMNRGVIYNGPLLVLVNGQSASASELLAASLQDYNRAIIAGTPTYGKATGQDIYPLSAANSVDGFAKLTMMKLYRPTGKSAQQKGVQPQVLIPDIYGIGRQREEDERFALPADTVAAYKYFKPMKVLAAGSLQQKSDARVAASVKFKEGKELAQRINRRETAGTISLKWDDAEKEVKALTYADREKIFTQPSVLYKVRNNGTDQKLAAAFINTSINDFWLKRLSADMYIEEAFQILSDFIHQ